MPLSWRMPRYSPTKLAAHITATEVHYFAVQILKRQNGTPIAAIENV
jgi:hypothetical protein